MMNVRSVCCREPLPDGAPWQIRIYRAVATLTRLLERRRWEKGFADARDQVQRLARTDHRFEHDILSIE
jgi:hypothetical protein